MRPTTQGKRATGWKRRWFGLLLGIALCLLMFSIWTEGQPRWKSGLHVFLGLICLGFGIYEFVRSDAKDKN
jgi:hypothetical protein